MADSNAPEHTDRGFFGLLGKKDGEKEDQHVQQQSHTVDPHATHAPAYTGGVHPTPPPAVAHQPQHYGQGAGVNAYSGDVRPAPPPVVSHQPQHSAQGEGEKKQHEGLMGKLHRSNSSSSSSSSDEDESGRKKEGRKKKGMKEKRPGHQGEKEAKEEPEKKGLMEKIKDKLPGHKEGEKGH